MVDGVGAELFGPVCEQAPRAVRALLVELPVLAHLCLVPNSIHGGIDLI